MEENFDELSGLKLNLQNHHDMMATMMMLVLIPLELLHHVIHILTISIVLGLNIMDPWCHWHFTLSNVKDSTVALIHRKGRGQRERAGQMPGWGREANQRREEGSQRESRALEGQVCGQRREEGNQRESRADAGLGEGGKSEKRGGNPKGEHGRCRVGGGRQIREEKQVEERMTIGQALNWSDKREEGRVKQWRGQVVKSNARAQLKE